MSLFDVSMPVPISCCCAEVVELFYILCVAVEFHRFCTTITMMLLVVIAVGAVLKLS